MKNRQAIERMAARLIRERGLQVSVADLMGAAGLTVGGFYGHFASKDALLAIACSAAFAESAQRWRQRIADAPTPQAARAALIARFLSEHARSAPGTSCPAAALPIDVAREGPGKPVGTAFHDGLVQLVSLLAEVQPQAGDAEACRNQALAELSTMVGALILARATQGQPISDALLQAARAHLNVPD